MRREVLSARDGPWLLTPAAGRHRHQRHLQHQPRVAVRRLGAPALWGLAPRNLCGRVPNLAFSLDGMAISPWAAEMQPGAPARLPCRRMATKALALGQALKPMVHRMRPRGLDDPVAPGGCTRGRRTKRQVQAGVPGQVKRPCRDGVPRGQQCDG